MVKLIKLNNLEYNTNRDPSVYRRAVNKDFRLQALMDGSGTAKGTFYVDGKAQCEANVTLPGTFECKFKFPKAGTHVGELIIENGTDQFRKNIRIDVMEHDWIG